MTAVNSSATSGIHLGHPWSWCSEIGSYVCSTLHRVRRASSLGELLSAIALDVEAMLICRDITLEAYLEEAGT